MRLSFVASLILATAIPLGSGDVALRVRETHGVYRVHGSFMVALPAADVWRVLADYEHIGDFVKAVHGSAFVRAANGNRVLQQDAVAGVFPFRRRIRVQLAVRETRNSRIDFKDVLGRDFHHYAGTWTADATPGGTLVGYDLEAEPRRKFPAFMGRGIISRSARDLLEQVRAEMLHRAARADAITDSAAAGLAPPTVSR